MIESSSWSLHSIDQSTADWFHFLLLLVGGFIASYFIYVWLNKIGRQFAGFSPTVASLLTAPLLAYSYYIFSTKDFIRGTIERQITRMILELVFLFGPIFLVLSPLLVIYLCGGFPRTRMTGIMLGAASLICLLLEHLWLYYLFVGRSLF